MGKDYTCKHCKGEDVFEVASHEPGVTPEVELEGECKFCLDAVSISELLHEDLGWTSDKLSEF